MSRKPIDRGPIVSDFQANKVAAKVTTDSRGKTLSGPQEAALQVMTDYFSRRPLVQMRNAFRKADKDQSGQLDIEEFQQAVRDMNTSLTDKDARTIFRIADEDGGGTLGIDEFFLNFRHDRWPREKFFWNKSCGGGDNISKKERVDIHAKLDFEQQNPVQRTTDEIMRVLEDRVHVYGSAEKVFRAMDGNYNGSLEVNELSTAIRPYQIELSDAQAEDVLARINAIAGKPALAPLNYNSFALAFNSSHPPKRMGGNFAEEHSRKPVRSASDAKLITYDSLARSHETIDSMKSVSTLPPARPLDHSATKGAMTDQERMREMQQQKRYDMLSGWRGVDGSGLEEGGQLGKEVMQIGRDIDWYADNQRSSSKSLYQDGAAMLQSRSMPQLTPLESGSAYDPLATQAPFDGPPSLASSRPGTNPQRSALGRTRSRLAMELESAGSQSTLECLYPGHTSHHHSDDSSRFLHTSSIASLNSISNAINGRADPEQVKQAEKRRQKVALAQERRREREHIFVSTLEERERQEAAAQEVREQQLSSFHRRFGEQQLCKLTRGMENGKRAVWLDKPVSKSWVPAPPHLTSHWRTIAGIHRQQFEDPGRDDQKTQPGRRRFPESERGTIVEGPGGGKPVWGGAPQPFLTSQPFIVN